jgi:hypothetical protein
MRTYTCRSTFLYGPKENSGAGDLCEGYSQKRELPKILQYRLCV